MKSSRAVAICSMPKATLICCSKNTTSGSHSGYTCGYHLFDSSPLPSSRGYLGFTGDLNEDLMDSL